MVDLIAIVLLSIVSEAVAPPAPVVPPEPDDRVRWLNENAVAIQSIDPDDDEDFSDLQPLKKLIGDARLVVLGEQSHGDGAVFYAKARLIKFLHREMGFDVLAWESGMFDCREVDRALRDPARPMDEIAGLGIFPIWTRSAQVRPTLDYVRATLATERPIETCGFDNQLSAGLASRWPQALLAFFDAADPNLLAQELRASLQNDFASLFERDPAKIESLMEKLKRIPALMDENRDALEKANSAAEFAFMRRGADDAVTSAKSMLEFLAAQAGAQPKATDNNTRDQRMGENLIWLVNERYKDRKIIAWMATMHAVHDVQKISMVGAPPIYDGVINCGTVAHKALGEKMYTIGFTAFDGQAGNVWSRRTMPLPAPSADSLEALCHETGKPFLLIDFNSLPEDHWLRQPLVSRPLGYGEMRAAWPDQMDAMLYIQTMFPSTQENALPRYARLRADEK